VVVEMAAHLDAHRVRGVALTSTRGQTPVPLARLDVRSEVFETGIKVVDLLAPPWSGAGRPGCSAAPASARRC
jgi:F0F1-type ATP synthase beta subunit